MSKKRRIVSTFDCDSTNVSTICLPIGPLKNCRSNSSCEAFLLNLPIICEKRKKNPLIASHKRLVASAI
uniref:Uncharacterized protein n=1 Tax=Romanomermis culicivorax TaxID=13658 RepID=A0A915IIS4_ROMCU